MTCCSKNRWEKTGIRMGRRKKKWYYWVVPTTKWPTPPPSCGQSTTFLWEFFYLLRIPWYGKIIDQIWKFFFNPYFGIMINKKTLLCYFSTLQEFILSVSRWPVWDSDAAATRASAKPVSTFLIPRPSTNTTTGPSWKRNMKRYLW